MPDSLQVALKNSSDSSETYAYITGIALQHGGRRCFLKADGQGLYFPKDPPAIGSPLTEDCAIPLGPPENKVTVTIPQMAGGRVYISRGSRLTFLLNPGPALVEPSVLNPTDANINIDFGFCEFTLNNDQFYANITYVDFVPRLPIAISLHTTEEVGQHVLGMQPNGVDEIANGLRQQTALDGKPWDKLIVECEGQILRVLSPTHGGAVGASFDGFFETYVDDVWKKFRKTGQQIKINTQAAAGVLTGEFISDHEIKIGDEVFEKPTTADIFGCNSGPFTTGPSETRNTIIPRLAAAFARSTLLIQGTTEHPSHPRTYYKQDPKNHYARLVHEHNVDGKGYAFAYDDVLPDDYAVEDQSGKVNHGEPLEFVVRVGGKAAQ